MATLAPTPLRPRTDTVFATTAEIIEAHALAAGVMARIAELWRRREWYRTHAGWLIQQHQEDRFELRQLVALARRARAVSRPLAERLDPITVAREPHPNAYPIAGWTEAEMREAYGR